MFGYSVENHGAEILQFVFKKRKFEKDYMKHLKLRPKSQQPYRTYCDRDTHCAHCRTFSQIGSRRPSVDTRFRIYGRTSVDTRFRIYGRTSTSVDTPFRIRNSTLKKLTLTEGAAAMPGDGDSRDCRWERLTESRASNIEVDRGGVGCDAELSGSSAGGRMNGSATGRCEFGGSATGRCEFGSATR
jgi:hypothetical protein